MKTEYKVVKPIDFKYLIDDIFTWHLLSKQKSLVVTLQGDLGAGKTTFTQELGRILNINEPITSPTFTIMKQYELVHKNFNLLVHIDAYRINDENEVGPLRLYEIFQRPQTIICVEWPEQIPTIIPDAAVRLKLKISKDDVRIVTVQLPIEK